MSQVTCFFDRADEREQIDIDMSIQALMSGVSHLESKQARLGGEERNVLVRILQRINRLVLDKLSNEDSAHA